MIDLNRPVGLVLAGGGGKGGYHIGAWKAIKELGIEIKAVTGTSVGALNGAFVAQGILEDALEVWENISVDKVIAIDKTHLNEMMDLSNAFDPQTINASLKYLDQLYKNKGLDITPLKALIESHVDEGRIRSSQIAYGLVTVSISDRKPLELFIEDIPEGQLVNYMLASSFLPGFMPMELDGKRFLDGGFHDNLPINLMTRTGVDQIIAIDLKAAGRKQPVRHRPESLIHIEPSGDLGRILEFNPERSRQDIQMGYLDTLKAFGRYKGHKYFLTGVPDGNTLLSGLITLGQDDIQGILDSLGLKEPPTTRMLMEKALPAIAAIFQVEDSEDYDSFLVKVLEHIANDHGLERLAPYEFNDFVDTISSTGHQTASKRLSRQSLNRLVSVTKQLLPIKSRLNIANRILTIYLRQRELITDNTLSMS